MQERVVDDDVGFVAFILHLLHPVLGLALYLCIYILTCFDQPAKHLVSRICSCIGQIIKRPVAESTDRYVLQHSIESTKSCQTPRHLNTYIN